MPTLVERVIAIARALETAEIPWALGGALALAYSTAEPRGTRDIDVNVFVPAADAARVFRALPTGVRSGSKDRRQALAEDQVRLWWDDTPVDLFFAADAFHLAVAGRCRRVPFAGEEIRVLAAEDLAVFKARFDRPKDWVDIEEMAAVGALDRAVAAGRLADLLGADDLRVDRLKGPPDPVVRG